MAGRQSIYVPELETTDQYLNWMERLYIEWATDDGSEHRAKGVADALGKATQKAKAILKKEEDEAQKSRVTVNNNIYINGVCEPAPIPRELHLLWHVGPVTEQA